VLTTRVARASTAQLDSLYVASTKTSVAGKPANW
jgi:hypothetical protein